MLIQAWYVPLASLSLVCPVFCNCELFPSLLIISYFSLYSMMIVFLSKIAQLLCKQCKETFDLVHKESPVPSRIHDRGSRYLRCTFHIVPKGGAFVWNFHDLPSTCGNFWICRLAWMGGNFLEMSERTSPIEKGPIVWRHCSPCLYVPGLAFIGQCMFSFHRKCSFY